ncbi:MAG: DUF2029 domain-containing protein, partial [Clostridia bacterium]|nr:DUF2029 domain-containing protein [Clostridia bacterium]
IPWFDEIQRGQITVMYENGTFNYSPLFFYLYKLTGDVFGTAHTHLVCKLLHIAAEMALSMLCFLGIERLRGTRKQPDGASFAVFCCCWLNPVLILNAAAWGQTDSFYVLFSVAAVLLLARRRPVCAMAAFALCCAWKMQGLFLLPLFILLYLCGEKPFSLLWFLLVPAVMAAVSLPMALIGGNPFQLFVTYFAQFGEHSGKLVLNYPNWYLLLGESANAGSLYTPVMIGALAIAFAALAVGFVRRREPPSARQIILLGAWSVLMCAFFLPRMHDRYALAGEVLLLCYALLSRRPAVLVSLVLCYTATLNAYAGYLIAPFLPDLAAEPANGRAVPADARSVPERKAGL